jgi:sugar/nucleoside kinase (ribokinase family)
MAKSLGLRVGIVTSWAEEVSLGLLESVQISNHKCDQSTTFENIETPDGRIQLLYHVAPQLDYYHLPEAWRNPAIVHLAPVAQEIEPSIVRRFMSSFIGVTPQGWLRSWGSDGRVEICEWPEAQFVLERAGGVVVSLHDLGADESRVEEMAMSSRVLAVTEGKLGSRIYWNGDVRRFRAPDVDEVDPTGAGDIFATAFFTRLFTTRDPWEAGRFATHIASLFVTRSGLAGIPTEDEIQQCMVEIF